MHLVTPWCNSALQVEEDPEYVFRFPDPDDGVGPPIISFNNVSFGYPGEGCGGACG